MLLLIDNYDSFTYNLYQLIGGIYPNIKVIRNDELTILEIKKLPLKKIVLSPGPGRPSDSGICPHIIKTFYDKIPILGICLGHQAIYEVFGGRISYANKIMHGKASSIKTPDEKIFKGLPKEIKIARYHSLAGMFKSLPDELEVLAEADGEIMAIKHKKFPVYGLQFHPESILTDGGKIILKNFLSLNIPNKEKIIKRKGEK
jgi:anthranilate synthase component 2